MYVVRMLVLIGLATIASALQAESWRTTDWSHKIISKGEPEEHRIATTESIEFYRGGKSKATITIRDEPFLALAFWTYRLEMGEECTYEEFTLTIDEEFPLHIEVEHLDSGGYLLRPLGVKFPQSSEVAEWNKDAFTLAFDVSQRIHLTVTQDCSGHPTQPERLDLTFSLRGGRAAMEFVEDGQF